MNVFNPIEYAISGCFCSNNIGCCYGPEDDMVDTVIFPTEHDILFGRGGKNNKHVGNERLRQMARASIQTYKAASKKGKSHISRTIVSEIRALRPPGRFLKRDYETGLWVEVGVEVAREKTSQALRDAVSAWNSAHPSTDEDNNCDNEKNDNNTNNLMYTDESDHQQERSPSELVEENEPRDDFLPPLPPISPPSSSMISSPPPPPKHQHLPAIVSPSRSSPSFSHRGHSSFARKKSFSGRVSPVPSTSIRISPTPVLSADFMGEIGADMNDFDLFNGSLLKKTGSASSGSLSFTQPREKKMRIDCDISL